MKNIYKQIANVVNFEESITILGFKDDGLYDMANNLITDEGINLQFQKTVHKKITVKKLGIRLVEKMLDGDYEKIFLEVIGFTSSDHSSFVKLIDKGSRVLILVEDIDRLENPVKIIDMFDQLSKLYMKQVNFVYLIEDVDVFTELESNLSPNSTFFENILFIPLNKDREKKDLETLCSEKYGIIKSKKILSNIFEQSSGHFELYKRLYKKEITSNKDSVENYARRLTNNFGDNTLKILRKLLNKVELSDSEKEIVKLYEELGFIQNNDITIPILKNYIFDLTPKQDVLYKDESGQIVFENIEQFTKSEITLLKSFIQHKGEIISKEDVGKIVWGKEYNKKYSPWALDQLIFRLRMKIDQLNINGEIKTIHGKGYMFNI